MKSSIIVPITEKFINKIKKDPNLLIEAEKITGTKVSINEIDLTALITSIDDKSDNLKMRDYIICLSYGLSEEDSKLVLEQDYYLYIIDLKEILGNKDDLRRVMGRIIGEDGKVKQRISESTGVKIHITDSKIFLLGSYEDVEYAKQAIQKIVNGSPHSVVFKFLEKVIRERKSRKIL
jgi:arCOG04150 universal archaeal KH domain protein